MSKGLELLENLAEAIAEVKHYGQCYGTHPYTYHLREVNSLCSSPESRIVAWLHDIMEDTDMEYDTILNLFGVRIADAVWALTKKDWVGYNDYIRFIKADKLAHGVKVCDTQCNLWQSERDGDQRRIAKYTKQLEMLLA